MDRNLQTDAVDAAARTQRPADRPISQDEALALALAAALKAHRGKCAVLETRHLPEDLSGFTTDLI